jgi:type III secretion protein J
MARLVLLLALAGCGGEPLLHGLDERQANQVLAALDESGLCGAKRRDPGAEGSWVVEVPAAEAARARRTLAERGLPRPESAGLAALVAGGGLVPTPAEERARLLGALAGELSRSLEAVPGVVEARVHLGLPPDDPLRAAPPPRAAVLVKVRPGGRPLVEPLAPGIQSLVAGAVAGLEPGQVAVVLAESAPPPPPAAPALPRAPLLLLAAAGAALALAALAAGLRRTAVGIPWPRLGRLLRP